MRLEERKVQLEQYADDDILHIVQLQQDGKYLSCKMKFSDLQNAIINKVDRTPIFNIETTTEAFPTGDGVIIGTSAMLYENDTYTLYVYGLDSEWRAVGGGSSSGTSSGAEYLQDLKDVNIVKSTDAPTLPFFTPDRVMKDLQALEVIEGEEVKELSTTILNDLEFTSDVSLNMEFVEKHDPKICQFTEGGFVVYDPLNVDNGGIEFNLDLKYPKDNETHILTIVIFDPFNQVEVDRIVSKDLNKSTVGVDSQSDSENYLLTKVVKSSKLVSGHFYTVSIECTSTNPTETSITVLNTSTVKITNNFVGATYAFKHEYMSETIKGKTLTNDVIWAKPNGEEEARMVDLNRIGAQFTQPSPFGVEDEPIQGGVSYVEQTSDPYGGSFSGCCLASNGKVFFAQAGGGPQSMCYDPQTGEVSPINLYSGESFSDAVPIKNGRVIFLCSSSRFSTCLFNANTLELEAINFVPVTSSGYACYNPARDELYFINNLTQLVILDPTSIEVTQQPADVWYLQYQTISGLEDAEYNAVCNAPNNKVVLAPAKSGDPILIVDMADGYTDDLDRVTQVPQSYGGYNDCKCTADGRIVFAPADVNGEAPPITILDISDIDDPMLTTVDSYTTVFATDSCCVTATNEVFFGREPQAGDFKVLNMDTLTVREIGRDGSIVPSIIGCCLLPDGNVIGAPADSDAKITLISFDQRYTSEAWHTGLYSQ